MGGINDPLVQQGRPAGQMSYRMPYVPTPEYGGAQDFTGAVEAEMLRHYRRTKPGSKTDAQALQTMYDNELNWASKKKGSPWKEPAIKNVLAQQTEQEKAHAKYWNEYRYSQGLDFLEQRFGNVMTQLEGVGKQERKDIRRSFKQMQSKLAQSQLGAGLTGTTVRGAQVRGVKAEEMEALGRAREKATQQRLGYESILSADIVSFIKDRTDTYPDVNSMANLYFGYGSGGSGAAAPAAKSGVGAAAAGMGAGIAAALICCAIFLEARYGNGTMDRVVRRYRDEMMTARNRRGYYKLSEVLVPMMRKSRFFKFLVCSLFVDPCVCWAKWNYREPGFWGRLGWIFTPIKSFWSSIFEYLGGDHEFIRANGEVI